MYLFVNQYAFIFSLKNPKIVSAINETMNSKEHVSTLVFLMKKETEQMGISLEIQANPHV